MKIGSFYAGLTFVVALCLTSCGGGTTSNKQPSTSDEVSENPSVEGSSDNTSSDDDVTTWFYTKNEDDLTHNVTSLNATVISVDSKRFDSNGNTARMVMQLSYNASMSASGEPKTSVMFTFTDDNDLCRYSDFQGSGFLAVFDDGPVDDTWTLVNMTSKRNSLFMYEGNRVTPFIQKLKSSKTAKIQVNLENVGKTTFTFNTAGLNWDFPN